jgi:hypothetical protein
MDVDDARYFEPGPQRDDREVVTFSEVGEMKMNQTLDEYAAERRRRPSRCATCAAFIMRPDLRAEADAGRAKPVPTSYATIAGYLRGQGLVVTPDGVKSHYTDGHAREGR